MEIDQKALKDLFKQKKMTLNKGDKVSVLDDDITGVVINIDGINLTIETSDGFEMEFKSNEVIKIESSELRQHIFSNTSFSDVIFEKESPKRRQPTRSKKKEKEPPAMEVDLHIHQLTDSIRGMTNHDMLTLQLDTARRQLEFAIKKRIPRIVFIHGVGEGILKLELEYLFGRYTNIAFYEANYQKYGLGATEVKVFQSKTPN